MGLYSVRMSREPEGAKRDGKRICPWTYFRQRELQKGTEGQPPRKTTRILLQIMAEINGV